MWSKFSMRSSGRFVFYISTNLQIPQITIVVQWFTTIPTRCKNTSVHTFFVIFGVFFCTIWMFQFASSKCRSVEMALVAYRAGPLTSASDISGSWLSLPFDPRPAGSCTTSARWSLRTTRTCRRPLSWPASVWSTTMRCLSKWRQPSPCRCSSATRKKVTFWDQSCISRECFRTAVHYYIGIKAILQAIFAAVGGSWTDIYRPAVGI